jgi:hypothetical protein
LHLIHHALIWIARVECYTLIMPIRTRLLNLVVAAVLCGFPAIAVAQPTADELLDRLAQPDLRNWDVVEQQLYQTWSRSGSASADYLLRQGRDALEADDLRGGL